MILSTAKITINFLILLMPLYKSIEVNSQTNVKIWQISEPLDFLTSNVELNSASLKRLSTMKSSIHKCGFLSVRMLLKAFGYTDQDLYYDHFGKPLLKDGRFISITHSHNYAAVVTSNQQVGIDIEKQRAKIAKIALKFVGYESNYLDKKDPDYIKKLTFQEKYIDSRFREQNSKSSSDFTYELARNINLPKRCAGFITDVTIPVSWHKLTLIVNISISLRGRKT